MPIGPETRKSVAAIRESGRNKILKPDEFAVPFNIRLTDFIDNYFSVPEEYNGAYSKYLEYLSEHTSVPFARPTCEAWLNGGRDPSLTSSEDVTRNNIYKFAALLGCDYDLTCELCEKVFFARPFNLKKVRELVYFYFSKHADDDEYPWQWYSKSEEFIENIPEQFNDGEKPPISKTRNIELMVSNMSFDDFRAFVYQNIASFEKENDFNSAVEKIREIVADTAGEDFKYDSYIDDITGFSARAIDGTNIKNVDSISAHIRSNFPTGAILNGILSGKEKSGDKIAKMLKMLLFYQYFDGNDDCMDTTAQFDGFWTHQENALSRAGIPPMYPKNPYDSLLLYSAAHDKPVKCFQNYLNEEIHNNNINTLKLKIKDAFKTDDDDAVCQFLESINCDRFLVDLICKAKADEGIAFLKTMTADMNRKKPLIPEDAGWGSLVSIYKCALNYVLNKTEFSDNQLDVLRLACLFPERKLSSDLLLLILNDEQLDAAYELHNKGWLTSDDKCWKIDYRIENAVNDDANMPTWSNMSKFESVLEKNVENLEIQKMLRELRLLDGAPAIK